MFLNKGANDGVEVGQVFEVFADRTIRRDSADVPFSPASSATIKVVKTSGKLSTAILLSAFDSVQQGDMARAPTGRRDGGEALEDVDMIGGPSAADDNLENEIQESDEF